MSNKTSGKKADRKNGQRKLPRIHQWKGGSDRARQLAELKAVRTNNRKGTR